MAAPNKTVVMLHGWAQNAHVMKMRTTKLAKKLNLAGYECVYLEAPHLLPTTSTVEIEGQHVQIVNGDRENAKAWFTYSRTDSADASLALAEAPIEYVGLESSIDTVKRYLMQWNGDFCAILGFSQGATFCHVLSKLAIAAKSNNGSSDLHPFSNIQCAIMLSGFSSMHSGKLVTSDESTSRDQLDIKSLHIFGERDTSVPKRFGEELAKQFRHAEMYDHGKGHVIPNNVEFCSTVIGFLDSCNAVVEQKDLFQARRE